MADDPWISDLKWIVSSLRIARTILHSHKLDIQLHTIAILSGEESYVFVFVHVCKH